ncbi:acid protease [Dendrothele bispora CBS 962.96]|uniref:Acid protease n=1 Tax=Dendrothele bispora (strain CBS 962.96) TaxID=1314807 RepID=A0A4S8MCX5_DENBC|nr:acid protease [Dendrothele bispora CBS 962.96]
MDGGVLSRRDNDQKKTGRRRKRGDVSGETGLGNNSDLLYTVPIEINGTVTAAHLDTGSSDLWLTSDSCSATSCNGAATANRFPSSSLTATSSQAYMQYGDSVTGTFASGPIGLGTATIAGIAIRNQAFAAVDQTDNNVVRFGAAGIFGLSFPSGSKIQEALVTDQTGPLTTTDEFVKATYEYGPLLARIAMTGALEMPMFAIELQRSTIDVGGQDGMLTVGRLPEGIDNSSLTWVPVRLYKPEEGGLRAPSFASGEVYPFRWEIDIDGVFLDGERIDDSRIPPDGVSVSSTSALIDTGNSLLRGPSDVVSSILSSVSSSFNSRFPVSSSNQAILPCNVPRTLAFQIGGKMFPIDPRDFIGEGANDGRSCAADNLVATDPPSRGALFRWSLGDPFMKSNLVAFHYGNLTHPSVDPPRIGFLSMVPENANQLLIEAVNDAQANGGRFESTLEVAPTASAATAGEITVSPGFTGIGATTSAEGATRTQMSPTAAVTVGLDDAEDLNDQNTETRLRPSTGTIMAIIVSIFGVGMAW